MNLCRSPNLIPCSLLVAAFKHIFSAIEQVCEEGVYLGRPSGEFHVKERDRGRYDPHCYCVMFAFEDILGVGTEKGLSVTPVII